METLLMLTADRLDPTSISSLPRTQNPVVWYYHDIHWRLGVGRLKRTKWQRAAIPLKSKHQIYPMELKSCGYRYSICTGLVACFRSTRIDPRMQPYWPTEQDQEISWNIWNLWLKNRMWLWYVMVISCFITDKMPFRHEVGHLMLWTNILDTLEACGIDWIPCIRSDTARTRVNRKQSNKLW